ncbi:MAG: excinuclease ABC subunit UvrC [Dehalococcoidales bacterium]|jgi:excinuclease ABC subunit C
MPTSVIIEQLKQLPASPGVYLMKDRQGKILYVGKAANLRNRVRSYFQAGQKLEPKTKRLVARADSLDFLLTASEQEALILELHLIKSHRPHYNIRLKDDKTFPYLKIDLSEEWPRLCVTRRLVQDGSQYFGPFASAGSVRETLKVVKRIFPLRHCARLRDGDKGRACLWYHLGKCLAPCLGSVNRQEYTGVIKEVTLFLQGKHEQVIRDLEKRMLKAAQTLNFENAARLRDQIGAIKKVIEGQHIATLVKGEYDAIAFSREGDQTGVRVFFIRGSRLAGQESFLLEGTDQETPGQIMSGFLKQFYHHSLYVPARILLQHPADDLAVIREWLQSKRGSRVDIEVPRRGHKKELLAMVLKNAEQGLQQYKIKQFAAPENLDHALEEIQETLGLERKPHRMEGYDISNIQGRQAVGSMVVFEAGRPEPAHYRRFKIKTVPHADDYAMLGEVLRRRFKRGREAAGAWDRYPDLVLIDGGRGQLNAALKAMSGLGAATVATISLAKENEAIFLPDRAEPLILERNSPGLRLLQHLRNEAHRFAIGYHLKVRRKAGLASALDEIPGIGAGRKRALLRKFGSVPKIREATEESLADTTGISLSLARIIKEHL